MVVYSTTVLNISFSGQVDQQTAKNVIKMEV